VNEFGDLSPAEFTSLSVQLWRECNRYMEEIDLQYPVEASTTQRCWSDEELKDDDVQLRRASFYVIEGGKR
jgi:hypothetical protein